MTDKNLISKKIEMVTHCLKRVEKYQDMDMQTFINNEDALDIVSHNLFLALQYMIDMGTHIIADDDLGDVSFLSDIATIFERQRIIPADFTPELKSMFGLRNIIAHEYASVDYKRIYHIIMNNLKDIYLYLDYIMRYCGL